MSLVFNNGEIVRVMSDYPFLATIHAPFHEEPFVLACVLQITPYGITPQLVIVPANESGLIPPNYSRWINYSLPPLPTGPTLAPEARFDFEPPVPNPTSSAQEQEAHFNINQPQFSAEENIDVGTIPVQMEKVTDSYSQRSTVTVSPAPTIIANNVVDVNQFNNSMEGNLVQPDFSMPPPLLTSVPIDGVSFPAENYSYYDRDMHSNKFCRFCFKNGKPKHIYKSHWPKTKDQQTVTCRYMKKIVCSYCYATGEKAHTDKYCPNLINTRTLGLSVAKHGSGGSSSSGSKSAGSSGHKNQH